MSFLDLTQDKAQSNDFSPIPSGTYVARLDKAEVRDTKDATGQFVNVRFKITTGEHANRVVFAKFNIKNKSEKAQSIGRSQLKSMMEAMGMSPVLENVTDLEGRAVVIKVGQEKKYNSEEMENVVKSYLSMNAAPAPTGQGSAVDQVPF